ncbi:hypothetical protein KA047_04010 [Candidatus Saccharibacteria bacterium]|nr:hypothetical protein [Candidatus Saccharibacteria bacterium]
MRENHRRTRANYLFGAGCLASFAIGGGLYLEAATDLLQTELSSYGETPTISNVLPDVDSGIVLQLSGGLILAAAGLASLSRVEG